MQDPTTFYSRTRDARKVIVVDLGFLGDTVHLVPALWDIKANYPAAELHVLTTPVGAEVLQLAPCVNRAWPLELNPAKRSRAEHWKTIRALRRTRFDVAFNFSGADRTIYLTALSGARWRVAHHGNRWHFYNRWLIPFWVPRQDPDLLVSDQRRRILSACGLTTRGPRKFDLHLDLASEQWVSSIVPPLAVHVSPSSSKATKEWPVEHHASMFRIVWESMPETRFLLSSSNEPRQLERARALVNTMGDPRVVSLPEALTIRQLAAILTRCRLHLGPDSGVLHLAAGFGCRTVSLFRQQGAYKSFMPQGLLHRTVAAPCHCIDGLDAPCEAKGIGECFEQISPARVAALVREQLLASSR